MKRDGSVKQSTREPSRSAAQVLPVGEAGKTCGHSSSRPRRGSLRCAGWFSPRNPWLPGAGPGQATGCPGPASPSGAVSSVLGWTAELVAWRSRRRGTPAPVTVAHWVRRRRPTSRFVTIFPISGPITNLPARPFVPFLASRRRRDSRVRPRGILSDDSCSDRTISSASCESRPLHVSRGHRAFIREHECGRTACSISTTPPQRC
jgi:hypothetical protein